MKARDPYHIALRALADFAGEGRFRWGQPLVATALATELRLSPTPVREALARLAGEGVFDHRPGRGYFAPSPSASDIAELYGLHRRLVQWALEVPSRPISGLMDRPQGAMPLRLETLYAAMAAGGGDILARAQRRAAIQLRPIRIVETTVMPVDSSQVRRQEELLARGHIPALRAEVDIYHTDRVAASEAVFVVMRRSAESIDEI